MLKSFAIDLTPDNTEYVSRGVDLTTATAAPANAPARCPNCSQALVQPLLPYCPACGQETRVRPPTLREFAQQFGGSYFTTEGALWRTLRLLLLKPGELTRLYLAGRRKHYVLPLRLYLTISLVTLLLIRIVTSAVPVHVDFGDTGPQAREQRNLDIGVGPASAGLKDGVFFCEGLPAWVCTRLRARIDLDPKAMGQQFTLFRDRFVINLGGAMFVLMPAFALWLKLAYLNRRMRYTEHLVFALHVHAFWFFALALLLPDWNWLSAAVFVAVPWYTFAAMRRVYGGRRGRRLLRGALDSLLYGLTLAAALTGVAVWSLLV
ncbi:MAG: DUF3667 domain-containing protein [Betaproteobacteria bacterium]